MEAIAGRTVVITGAGAGIGQALAQGLVARGAHVVAISRSQPGLEATRERCSGPGTLQCHAVDVTDAAALAAAMKLVVQQRGTIDVLINGAAVYPRTLLAETEPAHWAADVATNVNGVAFGCWAALRELPARSPALILNVGSFAYLGPEPKSTLYCASKAAVDAFTKALAVELASTRSPVVVNHWIPGIYKTRMSGYTGEDPALATDRLLSVIGQSRQGLGGRTFLVDREFLPRRGIRARIKGLLTGKRG
jgi:NAD(P)-dependent dehydrogenase (short-subunit alcohol dehydrogenase family)